MTTHHRRLARDPLSGSDNRSHCRSRSGTVPLETKRTLMIFGNCARDARPRSTFPRDPLVSACLACACAGPPLPPSPLPPPRAVRPFVRLWIRAPHQTEPYRIVSCRSAPRRVVPYRRAAPRPNLNSASRDPDVVPRTLPLPTSAARRQPLARVSIAPIASSRVTSRELSPFFSVSLFFSPSPSGALYRALALRRGAARALSLPLRARAINPIFVSQTTHRRDTKRRALVRARRKDYEETRMIEGGGSRSRG